MRAAVLERRGADGVSWREFADPKPAEGESVLRVAASSVNRVDLYKRDVRRLADHGIGIMSGLIFGFDEDGPDVFRRTLEGAIEIGLGGIVCSLLVPYPGTPLYDRMNADGRLLTKDWSQYTSDEVVFTPRQLTADQLRRGHDWVGQQFHRYPNIFRRWWNTGLVNPPLFWLKMLL